MTRDKPYSADELARHDGTGDGPALVAVDGKVYDVSPSKLWPGAKHMNAHLAGRDLSAAIKAAPHGPAVLERLEQVGVLDGQEPVPATPAGPPALVAAILSRHPHPVSVHFPIALGIAGAIFMLAGMALGIETLEKAGFLNVAFATLSSPGAVGAGLLSWYYNYGHAMTPIFRKKILLSVLYMAVATATVALYLLLPAQGALRYVPAGIVALLPAVALGLGYLGGKITFPS